MKIRSDALQYLFCMMIENNFRLVFSVATVITTDSSYNFLKGAINLHLVISHSAIRAWCYIYILREDLQ